MSATVSVISFCLLYELPSVATASLHAFTQKAVNAKRHTMSTMATIHPRDFFWEGAGWTGAAT